MNTLEQFSPNVEVYSIDEMFLQFDGFQIDLIEYGHKIKNTLWKNIRMPVGVGIAPSKTLSKLANQAAKQIPKCAGVCFLPPKVLKKNGICGNPIDHHHTLHAGMKFQRLVVTDIGCWIIHLGIVAKQVLIYLHG